MSVEGLHLLHSVDEIMVRIISSDSASFGLSSSMLDYSHPHLTELTGNINCTEFITEATSKT